MKNFKLIFTFIILLFSGSAYAVSALCGIGSQGGMNTTAYADLRTDGSELDLTGTFYAMAISYDPAYNIKAQIYGEGQKKRGVPIGTVLFVRSADGNVRKIRASTGLSFGDAKTCESGWATIRN